MWKDVKVIMLPTNKSELYLLHGNLNLSLHGNISQNDGDKEPQHLYIISLDEEIKEGDWYYNSKNNTINQLTSQYGNIKESVLILNNNKYCHKVIATTDSSLLLPTVSFKEWDGKSRNLPQITQQFIEEWIAEYNKGVKVEDLEVEYFIKQHNQHSHGIWDEECLKISKDNFISLRRKEKRVYTREETESLIVDGMRFMNSYIINHDTLHGQEAKQVAKNWIKENL